jgi:hypothetical protein
MNSKLTKKQIKEIRKDYYVHGKPVTMLIKIRYDDECGNGHNSFAVTAEEFEKGYQSDEKSILHKDGSKLYLNSCGCLHEEIAKRAPELSQYIKWHLCSSDAPLYYTENTMYWVSEKNYDNARSCALWPDASESELQSPDIKDKLLARLPSLMDEFKKAVESLGFEY